MSAQQHDDKSLCRGCNAYVFGEHEPDCAYNALVPYGITDDAGAPLRPTENDYDLILSLRARVKALEGVLTLIGCRTVAMGLPVPCPKTKLPVEGWCSVCSALEETK